MCTSINFLATFLSCILTGVPLVVKVGKDVVVDNSLFVDTLLTIVPTIEALCPHLCDDLTDGKTNLRKYDKKSGVCECFFASQGFRDSRKVAPVSEGVVFFVNRWYISLYFSTFKKTSRENIEVIFVHNFFNVFSIAGFCTSFLPVKIYRNLFLDEEKKWHTTEHFKPD